MVEGLKVMDGFGFFFPIQARFFRCDEVFEK